MYTKYSKKNINSFKQEDINNNLSLLTYHNWIRSIYIKQPLRANCKNCLSSIENKPRDFVSHDIPYIICDNCSHINGMYEDNAEFAKEIYCDNAETYGVGSTSSNLEQRNNIINEIYEPKAKFLIEVLNNDNFPIESVNILDVGCGYGTFVEACLNLGLNVRGLEVSQQTVDATNQIIGKQLIDYCKFEDINDLIKETSCNVLALIGVLEHLTDPHSLLKSFQANKNLQYLYLHVPMMSFSVYLEMFFPDSYNRLLGGGHTHLYTQQSLDWLAAHYNLTQMGRWIFGGDIMDFCHHGIVKLKKLDASEVFINDFKRNMELCVDNIQHALDINFLSSEIHIVLSKARE